MEQTQDMATTTPPSSANAENVADGSPPSGFYLPTIRVGPHVTQSSSDAQMDTEIGALAKLRRWTDFNRDVRTSWRSAKAYLGPCADEMLNVRCDKAGCGEIAKKKHALVLLQEFRGESQMYEPIITLCNALIKLVNVDGSDWEGMAWGAARTRTFDGIQSDAEGRMRQVTSDISISDMGMYAQNGTPEACIEVKLPFHSLDIPEDFDAPEDVDNVTSPLVERYQRCLRSAAGDPAYKTWVRKAFCQTILQAMHTRTGCASLTTLNEAVFVQVAGTLNDGKVDVLLSDVFKNGGIYSVLHGTLGFITAVRSKRSTTETNQRMLAEIVVNMPSKYRQFRERERSRRLESVPAGTAARRHQTSGDVRTSNGTDERRRRVLYDSSNLLLMPVDGKGAEGKYSALHAKETETKEWGAWLTDSERSMVERAMKSNLPVDMSPDLLERTFLMGPQTYVGSGLSGFVISTTVQGIKVVVKQWNWDGSEGLKCLRNEVQVYKHLLQRYPDVVGEAIPPIYALTTEPPTETALVSKFVGQGIKCLRDGFSFNGKKLNETEKAEISVAAARSLTHLARCGVIHNDATVRNLRLERKTRKGLKWNACWIDLGSASLFSPSEDPERFEEIVDAARAWKL